MVAIRSLDFISKKWKDVTPGRAAQYKLGVQSPRRSWSEAAQASDEARKAGLAAADARNAFQEGVAKAGDAKWKRRAETLGSQRFGPGVQAGQAEYQSGFSPYHSVIQAVQLPPRGAKGSPGNYDRSRMIGEALHSAKVGA